MNKNTNFMIKQGEFMKELYLRLEMMLWMKTS